MRTLLSTLAVARSFPSGLKETVQTRSPCLSVRSAVAVRPEGWGGACVRAHAKKTKAAVAARGVRVIDAPARVWQALRAPRPAISANSIPGAFPQFLTDD